MVDSKASNISSETNKVPQCYKPKVSFFSYLRDELKRDYLLQQNEKKLMERRKRVYTFVKTPKELEKFLLFGFLLCFDVFLFVFTFLPIRILFALFTAVKRLLFCNRGNLVEPAQKIDLMKALHTILNLLQVIVLNVALNSYNKALLTIMISNQFIEIKSSVFKRFEKNNLFQISCSDARERFHNVTLLLVVAMRNLTEYEWNLDYACSSFIPFAAVVIGSEFLVDWFKHAFITKFNDIQPDVYLTYRAFLAKNLLVNNCDTVFSGHTDQVSRRMGFTVLPMAALLIRICSQCVKLSNWSGLLFIILFYLCLCALKFIVSIHILGKSVQYVKEQDIKEKPFEPCWSFSPLSSVQEIHGGFNSDTKLFTSSVPET
ncbi:transmembrane anterior posterior transformation protein 1 homolog isoform X2 [Hydra vulgaris]|uniref:Transmembrane anterior posterior transformation protein 1 homolog isoform X2 n=1 Tax=Hydra vulgaris TaxID=6087 RepID=A0ABM4BK41_HYDVU